MNEAQSTPYGYCHCGCGGVTPLATQSLRSLGVVKGEPRRFMHGHSPPPMPKIPPPNPTGMCMCGCGGVTRVAPRTDLGRGWIKNEHVKCLPGHRTPSSYEGAGWHEENRGYDTLCWIWRGRPGHNGYGQTGFQQALDTAAHRHVWLARGGEPIPKGWHLHHECEVRMCVNPAHLVPMSKSDHLKMHAERRLRSEE